MSSRNTTTAHPLPLSEANGTATVTTPQRQLRRQPHPFFGRRVTPGLRRTLFDQALRLLVARRPDSQAGLDPVIHYTPFLENFLDWLEHHPGDSHQDRWLSSGADTAGRDWLAMLDGNADNAYLRMRFNRGLEAVVCCGAIRPTYTFLLSVWSKRLWSTWREEHDRELFALIEKTALQELRRPRLKATGILIDFARISIHTGKALGELTCTDLVEYRQACIDVKGSDTTISWASAYHCGRAVGLFLDGPQEFQALLTARQLSPAEMAQHYGIASRSMRLLLTEYLAERRPNLDYTSFYQLSQRLCRLFWRDIEDHHPGINSHHLSRKQIEDWKARVEVLDNGRDRRRPGEADEHSGPDDLPLPVAPPGPGDRTDRWATRARERHAAVHALLADGVGINAICRQLGLARGTVRRFARAEAVEELLTRNGTGHRPSLLEQFKPYLHDRWNAGCTNATVLFTEIATRGYEGGPGVVRSYCTSSAPPPASPSHRASRPPSAGSSAG